MVECLTRDRGAAGSGLTGVTALCPLARHINPYLVLVLPSKTRPDITVDWDVKNQIIRNPYHTIGNHCSKYEHPRSKNKRGVQVTSRITDFE